MIHHDETLGLSATEEETDRHMTNHGVVWKVLRWGSLHSGLTSLGVTSQVDLGLFLYQGGMAIEWHGSARMQH